MFLRTIPRRTIHRLCTIPVWAPNREAYLEKSCKFLLNAISHPQDMASTQKFLGKELRHWNIGAFNFTPNYSLDHHAYMNVG
ncbi:MAG: hypothetical protein IKC05_03095, partial [Lentisphaeria bacterium]|nr:hypothetical protein [Lentisphaeria bacterium]